MPHEPVDLSQHNYIRYNSSGHVNDWELRKPVRIERIPVSGNYIVSSSFAVHNALCVGFGISLIPIRYISDEVHLANL